MDNNHSIIYFLQINRNRLFYFTIKIYDCIIEWVLIFSFHLAARFNSIKVRRIDTVFLMPINLIFTLVVMNTILIYFSMNFPFFQNLILFLIILNSIFYIFFNKFYFNEYEKLDDVGWCDCSNLLCTEMSLRQTKAIFYKWFAATYFNNKKLLINTIRLSIKQDNN